MYQDIIKFWFEDSDPSLWFATDESFDRDIEISFGELHKKAARGELSGWRATAEGRLAEIILLDQFSRNIFRGKAEAFAYDNLALVLAQEAVHVGADMQLDVAKRAFIYMPYMHSESQQVHKDAVHLFSQVGMESNLEFELRHKEIIDRFGRYPHRNAVLGRESSPDELSFLEQRGSSF